MRVLVDGHNALAALRIRGATHEEQREALLRRIAAATPRATVYFDARRAPAGLMPEQRRFGLDVVFCRTREADDAILEAVRDADQPSRLVVVTNDNEVAGRAAQLGAQALGVAEFFGPPEPPEPSSGPIPLPRSVPRFTPADFGLPNYVDLERPLPDDE
ncbi:MAG: NYN domain-containing protein [Planctomycetota bacterium]|nr:NYN domain-containing protein [Planctomycetota bacterium]